MKTIFGQEYDYNSFKSFLSRYHICEMNTKYVVGIDFTDKYTCFLVKETIDGDKNAKTEDRIKKYRTRMFIRQDGSMIPFERANDDTEQCEVDGQRFIKSPGTWNDELYAPGLFDYTGKTQITCLDMYKAFLRAIRDEIIKQVPIDLLKNTQFLITIPDGSEWNSTENRIKLIELLSVEFGSSMIQLVNDTIANLLNFSYYPNSFLTINVGYSSTKLIYARCGKRLYVDYCNLGWDDFCTAICEYKRNQNPDLSITWDSEEELKMTTDEVLIRKAFDRDVPSLNQKSVKTILRDFINQNKNLISDNPLDCAILSGINNLTNFDINTFEGNINSATKVIIEVLNDVLNDTKIETWTDIHLQYPSLLGLFGFREKLQKLYSVYYDGIASDDDAKYGIFKSLNDYVSSFEKEYDTFIQKCTDDYLYNIWPIIYQGLPSDNYFIASLSDWAAQYSESPGYSFSTLIGRIIDYKDKRETEPCREFERDVKVRVWYLLKEFDKYLENRIKGITIPRAEFNPELDILSKTNKSLRSVVEKIIRKRLPVINHSESSSLDDSFSALEVRDLRASLVEMPGEDTELYDVVKKEVNNILDESGLKISLKNYYYENIMPFGVCAENLFLFENLKVGEN